MSEQNPFDGVGDSGITANRMASSVFTSANSNPDAAAKMQAMAGQLDLTPDIVARNHAEAVRQSLIKRLDFSGMAESSPITARWFGTPDNAAIAHDIIPHFQKMEGMLPAQLGDTARELIAATPQVAGMTMAGAGRYTSVALQEMQSPSVRDAFRSGLMNSIFDPSAIIDTLVTKPGVALAEIGDRIRPPVERRSPFTSDVINAVGQIVPQAAMTALAPEYALPMLLAQGIGGAHISNQQMDYADDSALRTQELLTGAFTGYAEKLGLDAVFNRLPPAVKAAMAQGVAGIAAKTGIAIPEAAANIGEATLTEGGTEIAEQLFQNLSEKLLINPETDVTQGLVQSGAAGGGAGALFRSMIEASLGVHNVRTARMRDKAEAVQTSVQAIHEAMQSPGAQAMEGRDPARHREFLRSTDDNKTFHIAAAPMQELFQSLPDDTRKVLLDALPGFQGQLEEAAAADTDIIMRRGDYAALFASQPWSEPLIPHVRENQLDVSAAELKALIENKDIQNDIDQAPIMERLETRLQRRLQDSIQNAGVTPSIANTQSRLLERFIGRTDRLRSLAGETGDISAKLERALSFRRSASEYTQPERVDELTQHLTNIQARFKDQPDVDASYQNAVKKYEKRVQDEFGGDKNAALAAKVKPPRRGTPRKNFRKNFPVLDYIVKTAGGIDPSGSFGRELAAQDVTPKTHPWIFKTGGVGEIDALDATSLKNAFPKLNLETSELGKYSVNDLHEIIRQEMKNPSMNKEETARSAAEDNLMSILDEGLGLSLKEIEALTPDNLRALLAEYEAGGRSEDSNQFDQAANGKTPYTEPTITVDGKERPTTNSNGKPIAATKEGLENFWRWFGDSQVNERPISSRQDTSMLRPLVVYHGSPNGKFDEFDHDRTGTTSFIGIPVEVKRYGFYFAEDKGFADSFASQGEATMGDTLEVYLSIKNPLWMDGAVTQEDVEKLVAQGVSRKFAEEYLGDPRETWSYLEDSTKDIAEGKAANGKVLADAIKAAGFDGIFMKEVDPESGDAKEVWIAFSPNQIKSATGNNGNFSREDNNILHQAANPDAAPIFYSQVQRVVEGLKQGKATAEQWLKTIQNTPGVKQEELDWMGLPEWLAKQDGPVTKAALVEFINANQITVEEVVKGGPIDALPAGDTKFGRWQLPGGENYRELIFTLPLPKPDPQRLAELEQAKEEAKSAYQAQERVYNEMSLKIVEQMRSNEEEVLAKYGYATFGEGVGNSAFGNEFRRAGVQNPKIKEMKKEAERFHTDSVIPLARRYQTAIAMRDRLTEEKDADVFHTDAVHRYDDGKSDDNRLAWLRFNERTDADGKRVLFIEEIQSDWHQAGRDKGYKKGEAPSVVPVPDTDGVWKIQKPDGSLGDTVYGATEAQAQSNALDRVNQSAVPDAPFKTTWPELAFKRALRWAVDNGFDRVAWTTGEQQADRYDLSKQIDHIDYRKNSDGTYKLGIVDKNGEGVALPKENYTAEELVDVVGKDVADKIANGEGQSGGGRMTLRGLDLKVGGEGMRTFYDKMLPSMANKLTKKWGGKVGETAFKGKADPDSEIRWTEDTDGIQRIEWDGGEREFNTEEEARAFRDDLRNGAVKVHSLDITPAMREAAKAGLALFQESRGSISFDTMLEKVVISLSSGANLSTMLHEFGHYAALLHRQTAQIARDALAAGKVTDPAARAELEQVIKDWDTLKEKLGVVGDTLTVDQEEQIAKWFEQYLREGKSPSAELNDIFATFKSWMLQIYKTIKDLGKPINDDVRQVFDRWIASDEEIKAAQSVNLQIEQIAAQFDMLDATGLSKEQAEARAAVGAKVARLLNKSGNRASEALLAEVLKEESKKQTEEYKADYAKTLEEVTKAADESRVYAAQDHIKAGHQMDAKLVEQVVGKDIAKRLPNGLRGGKSSPDLIAMQFGYIDGAEMIREIVSNVPKKVFIAQETERLMQARHGNMLEDGRAADRARILVANDEVGEAIELLVKTAGEKKQTRRLVKAAARQRMLNTRYADITPGKYSAARDKALRAAYAAGTKAKGGEAAQHLWKAMLNHELLMAANQAKADQAKAQKLYDKINKKDTKLPDSWDAEYVYFARYLLANAGLSTNKGFNPNKWLVDAQERNPELMGQLAEAYKDFMPEKNWKSMTALELSSLHMVVQNIIHIGRENKAFVRAGEKTTIENALSEIVQSLQSQGYSTVQPPLPSSMTMGAKAAKVLYDMEGSLVRIEALCKHLDGGNSFGPMSQSIYRPISDAVNRGKPISNAFITKLAKVMAEREAEYSSSGSIAAPELFSEHFNGVFRNKWDVIACLLNYGNASSATKLIDGYKWNEADLLGVFNKHLNARDVEFVQRIWDVLNEVKPYVKEEYYQRTGLSLVEIEPRSFDLHGQTWRGGYYPAAYSREHVANSKIGERADLDQSLFGAEGSSWPAPNKGSSIERTGYVGPIDLNPMVSIRHVEQSIHRWAVAKDIRQTARLVNRPEFQSAMAAINPSYRGLFMPWLRAVARDTVDDAAMTSWDKAAKILRNRATVMIMGLNLRNAMQNLSGYPIVSREIGGKYFMEGMASYAENPQAATDFIFERSAEMKMRYQNLDREQQEVLRDIAAGKKTAIGKLNSKIQPYAFALSNATDALVSRPAWLGAYKKAKAENKSDADAAYYADSVVRLNVGIGNVKDVAALQRGNQFARTTLVMFYSYMNMVYNLNRSEFLSLKRTGASGIPSFLAGQMLVNIIPNLIAAGIVDALGGGGAGADDEDWLWWYARRVFSGMFGLVPIVGDFGELIIDEATNEKFFDRFQNPVFSMLGTIGSAVIGDGEAFFQEDPNYSQVVKTTITAMAGTFGTPINDLRHPLGTLADWAEGDSEPAGVWQAVQQLMGAPPPKD